LLACNPFGATEAIMHVHGFTLPMLATLVRAGLATAQSETGKAIAVGHIRITDAGRRWLENATNRNRHERPTSPSRDFAAIQPGMS
jgi:DNA-binding PadR family transcriptional regulator